MNTIQLNARVFECKHALQSDSNAVKWWGGRDCLACFQGSDAPRASN